MDQHVETHQPAPQPDRRRFFKRAVGVSSAFAVTALTGIVTVPHFVSAHGLDTQAALTNTAQVSLLPQDSKLRPFYRLYNQHNGDHFYTMDPNEANNALNHAGYTAEGSACYVLVSHEQDTTPLYRLYNQHNGDHFYTIDQAEAQRAVQHAGYTLEGIACYVLTKKEKREISFAYPFYRLYDANTGDHFYTTNASERDAASHNGYAYEGIACYVL